MRAKRAVVVGVVGAVLAGVVVGVVARLLMRVVRVAAGGDGDFTWSGSLFIPLIYAAAMIPGGIVAALTLRWWRWLAVGAGSVFLMFPAIGVASEEIGDTTGLSAGRRVALVVTSLAVFATIAVVAVATVKVVDRLGRETALLGPAVP